MSNHEHGKKRPTYFTIKDKDILWFIPLSSKVDKYQKIINKKIEKGVVDGYKKIEQGVTKGYTKIEDKFVDAYLTKDGETVEEAKERLKKENK